jgi:hypothetical protein
MHFRVDEWLRTQDPQSPSPICPWRVLDPATGSIISHVNEFNDDEGWLRVMCRSPQQYEGQTHFAYCASNSNSLVTQIVYRPFQVVPYYKGIDDLPEIFLDTVLYNGGNPVGPWIPHDQPHDHSALQGDKP